jgi:hypothetical protein
LGYFRTLDGCPLLLDLVGWAVKLEERLGRILGCLLLLLLQRLMGYMILALLSYLFPFSFGRFETEGDGGIVVSDGTIGVYPLVVFGSRVISGSGKNLLNFDGRPILRHLLPVMLSYQLVSPLAVDPA